MQYYAVFLILANIMDYICFLYCVSSKYTDLNGYKKLGMTVHPVHRMRVYNTGDAPGIGLDKKYDGIWQVNAKSKIELLNLEKDLHAHFEHVRQKRAGKNTEWFAVSFESVEKYLSSQTYVIRQLSIEEINIIQVKSESNSAPEDMEKIMEETNLIAEQNMLLLTSIHSLTLKEEFFTTFLCAGTLPRRIQNELWDLWEQITKSTSKYRGIVNWATGTGKTIALLMLFVISANNAKKQGQIFRGLLIAPKNDIFNTIIHHIRKLSKWGISVCEGHNAHLSSLNIPLDKPVLITATHASLTDSNSWNKLPNITHCHYDEVHRITGDEFYKLLQAKLDLWNTGFLTGTSATPKTCAPSQHKKIAELFGDPLQILHKCDVDEAIAEGWIAQPRFGVNIISKNITNKHSINIFVNIVRDSIIDKQTKGLWNGGKVIAYLSTRADVCNAVVVAKELMPDWHIYSAVEDADASDDDKFVKDVANGEPRILFACERYREGSDIKGIEMTCILMGNTIGANILLQVVGRALRNDYKNKEGWCIIVRPSNEGTTEDDVFDSIVLEIMEFMGNEDAISPSRDKIKRIVEKFFGSVAISGKIYNIDETIHRIQAMNARKAFERADPKEKYEVIRALNKELKIATKNEYKSKALEHPKYIENPKYYFKDHWISWYHFLGVDTSAFPQTKSEWIRIWKDMGITSWSEYKENRPPTLPENPGEMYEDYTNPDAEFGVEENHEW